MQYPVIYIILQTFTQMWIGDKTEMEEIMEIRFINIEYGEAILITCDGPSGEGGRFMMLIDEGSAMDHYRNIKGLLSQPFLCLSLRGFTL